MVQRESPGFAFVIVGLLLAGACSGGGGGNVGIGGAGGKGGNSGVDAGLDVPRGAGGSTGVGGSPGVGGSIGTGGAPDNGVGGSIGTGGAPDNGVGGAPDAGPGDAALPPDAGTVTCPTIINGSLDTTDGTQTGRHSRIAPISACGATKAFPMTGPDSVNPHLYDVYRFVNPTAAALCFTFTLTSGATVVADGGLDAVSGADGGSDVPVGEASDGAVDAGGGDGTSGAEAGSTDASAEVGGDAASADAAADSGVVVGPPRYLAAYSTFFPGNLAIGYLGDVGNVLVSPQTMGITVPAGGSIDVVVYAIDVAPGGVGAYTLGCAAQ